MLVFQPVAFNDNIQQAGFFTSVDHNNHNNVVIIIIIIIIILIIIAPKSESIIIAITVELSYVLLYWPSGCQMLTRSHSSLSITVYPTKQLLMDKSTVLGEAPLLAAVKVANGDVGLDLLVHKAASIAHLATIRSVEKVAQLRESRHLANKRGRRERIPVAAAAVAAFDGVP